ncbi:hypothetical protein ACIQMV_08595 [Streptomyces sp. NPDC091412]|uniref:hypothetical protein n=1 Tax=Streptomyces sp. NPDC091412 TaxID=3366002 RepID=UPI00380952C9
MSAELLTEAINAAVTLGWALAAWIAVLAAVATLAILGTAALLATAARALWRRRTRPSWACGRLRARIHAYTRTRRSQGRTAELDYREAA